MSTHRSARPLPTKANAAWSMDFMSDRLSNRSKIRLLTVIDVLTRETLAIEVGPRLRGENVAHVLNKLVYLYGRPDRIFCDNGAEFTGQIVDFWADTHKVKMDVSRPGTPTDNVHIESFNGTVRDERLNVNCFRSVAEAQRLSDVWRRHYNESRPHMAHKGRTPREFANISSLWHSDDMKMAAGF